MSKPDFSALTQRECAAIHGVDERTIRRWSDDEDGMPRNDDGTYNAPLTLGWRIQKESGAALDLNAERARLAKEQADKTALDNAAKRGELLTVQSVSHAWSALISVLRANLLGMPSKVAPKLATLKNAIAIRDYLTAELHRHMEEASNYRPGDRSEDAEESDHTGDGDTEAAAGMDSEPMGGRTKKAKRGVKRSAGAVDH